MKQGSNNSTTVPRRLAMFPSQIFTSAQTSRAVLLTALPSRTDDCTDLYSQQLTWAWLMLARKLLEQLYVYLLPRHLLPCRRLAGLSAVKQQCLEAAGKL